MGEVYRARDTQLGREVAIKFLPEDFSNFERLARFDREARLLASLNHPNIATLHGLEQSGEIRFLVMELVPGETLAERNYERTGSGNRTLSCSKSFRGFSSAPESAPGPQSTTDRDQDRADGTASRTRRRVSRPEPSAGRGRRFRRNSSRLAGNSFAENAPG